MDSYWNYRFVKIQSQNDIIYSIHEVYYENNQITSISVEPIQIQILDGKDLVDEIEHIMNATLRKVLIIEDDKITELNEYIPNLDKVNKLRGGN